MLVEDVAEVPDQIANQLPHSAQALRELCKEAIAETPEKRGSSQHSLQGKVGPK